LTIAFENTIGPQGE